MKKFWQIAYTTLKVSAFIFIVITYGSLSYHELISPKKKKTVKDGWDGYELLNTNTQYYNLKLGGVLYDTVYQHDTMYIYKDSLINWYEYQPVK